MSRIIENSVALVSSDKFAKVLPNDSSSADVRAPERESKLAPFFIDSSKTRTRLPETTLETGGKDAKYTRNE